MSVGKDLLFEQMEEKRCHECGELATLFDACSSCGEPMPVCTGCRQVHGVRQNLFCDACSHMMSGD